MSPVVGIGGIGIASQSAGQCVYMFIDCSTDIRFVMPDLTVDQAAGARQNGRLRLCVCVCVCVCV